MVLYSADKYTYRILWSEDRRCYVGVCTEFPELSYQAKDHAEALAGIITRVTSRLEDKRKAGETVPLPIAVQRFKGTVW